MSKLITEIQVYEYNNEAEMNKEIMALSRSGWLSKSEWLLKTSYECLDGKWRAEYQKNY